jgi:hypothetical protein
MVTIDAFQPSDLATLIRFVEAIQEHERIDVPDLKSGSEIGPDYAQMLIRTAVRPRWLRSSGTSGDRDCRFWLRLDRRRR